MASVWLPAGTQPETLVAVVRMAGSVGYVAHAVGVSTRTVKRWRMGTSKPSPKHLRAIRQLVDNSVDRPVDNSQACG